MRPTLLLASLLAVIPFISATPAPRDGPIFTYSVTLPDNTIFTLNGCHGIKSLSNDLTDVIGGAGNIDVKTCLTACHAHDYNQGGVGNNQCLCDNDVSFGTSLDKQLCKKSTCPAASQEFCGSKNYLVLYTT